MLSVTRRLQTPGHGEKMVLPNASAMCCSEPWRSLELINGVARDPGADTLQWDTDVMGINMYKHVSTKDVYRLCMVMYKGYVKGNQSHDVRESSLGPVSMSYATAIVDAQWAKGRFLQYAFSQHQFMPGNCLLAMAAQGEAKP